jgi:uncharacterized protein
VACFPSANLGQTPDVGLDAKVGALRAPSAYSSDVRAVEAIETHFAWVFLTEQRAYKLKKPVSNEYSDLTSIAARKRNCEEEVRLNRRLAADTYLGVSSLNLAPDGSLRIDGPGTAVEWLVAMRRLPGELMLDRAIATHTAARPALIEVGRTLADFFLHQRSVAFDRCAYVDRIAEQMRLDRRALYAPDLALDEDRVKWTTAKVWRAFASVEDELALRAERSRIVEGHGDLRPEHICLTSPPRIIDGLEFSLDLRTLDPGEELSFLLMECGRAGDEGAGEVIVRTCLAAMDDPLSDGLLRFYRSRRAMVRAKLMAWHLCDPRYRTRAPWRDLAHAYLDEAGESADRACAPEVPNRHRSGLLPSPS